MSQSDITEKIAAAPAESNRPDWPPALPFWPYKVSDLLLAARCSSKHSIYDQIDKQTRSSLLHPWAERRRRLRRPSIDSPVPPERQCRARRFVAGVVDTGRPPFARQAVKVGTVSFQILQNGANDQSSACETIFEVSPTSVLVVSGSCQSRLQREWAQDRVYSKPDLSSVAPLILPEVSPPFARLFLAVPVALFWLWVFVLWISAFLINLDFWRAARTKSPPRSSYHDR